MKGETALDAANKDVRDSVPTALPPKEKRRFQLEVTVSSPVFSQKDAELKMAIKLSLESLSQQGESIEVRSSARAPCNESSTSSVFTLMKSLNRLSLGHNARRAQ